MRPFFVLVLRGLGAQLVAPLRVEAAQPADALLDLRMRDEERGEAFLEERVERPERLGCRARLEVDELGRLLEPKERIGEAVRGPAELRGAGGGPGRALRREQDVGARRGDRAEAGAKPPLET